MMVPDDVDSLVREFARAWIPGGSLTPLTDAMNSFAWLVVAAEQRYVLKVADPSSESGLLAATCVEAHGIAAGAPIQTERRGAWLVALLRFVDGTPLVDDAVALGDTLARVHRVLLRCETPLGIARWPWTWPRVDRIREPGLRAAAERAVERAVELAPSLTHGVLHGDPAPEAFRRVGDRIGVIDWGAACHGPLLYDIASAVMYAGRDILVGYGSGQPLEQGELDHLDAFLAFRWAVQAWYFSERLGRGDLTGIVADADNERGLADARRALLRDGV